MEIATVYILVGWDQHGNGQQTSLWHLKLQTQ